MTDSPDDDVATGRGNTPADALEVLAATCATTWHHRHTRGHRRIYELASGLWEAQITLEPPNA